MKEFILGIRNKSAFVFSWLVLLWLIFCSLQRESEISNVVLWQLFILSLSGSVLHSVFFGGAFFKKTHFNLRLTFFIFCCALIESYLIYHFQLFGISKLSEWGLFLLIVIVLYLASLGVFQIYRAKSGKHYTKLLKQYQKKHEDTQYEWVK